MCLSVQVVVYCWTVEGDGDDDTTQRPDGRRIGAKAQALLAAKSRPIRGLSIFRRLFFCLLFPLSTCYGFIKFLNQLGLGQETGLIFGVN